MKRSRDWIIAVVGVIIVLLVPTGVAVRTAAGADGGDSNTKEVEILADAFEYAKAFGVSVEQARLELAMQEEVGLLGEALGAVDQDSFAGLWIEHQPYRVVVAAVGGNSPALSRAIEASSVAKFVEIRSASTSLRDLHEEADQLQAHFDGRFRLRINVQAGQIEIPSPDSDVASREIAASGLELPSNVVIVKDNRQLFQTANAMAGKKLTLTSSGAYECTSGFSVRDGLLYRYTTTAAHCLNNLTMEGGIVLTWINAYYSGSHDEQLHTVSSGNGVTNRIYDGSTAPDNTREVFGKTPKASQPLGAFYCKYGKTTFFGCGTVVDKDEWCANPNPASTCIWLQRAGVRLAGPGDSGGPVFNAHSAIGMIEACYSTDPNCLPGDPMVYIAENYLESGLGVTILTTP